MKLTDYEINEIRGGAGTITATFLNSLARVITTILDLGRTIGSSIRRSRTGNLCP